MGNIHTSAKFSCSVGWRRPARALVKMRADSAQRHIKAPCTMHFASSWRGTNLASSKDGELLEAPVAGVRDVYFAGQGGLFDVVLDPDFETNQTIYLSCAHGDQDANARRVLRAVLWWPFASKSQDSAKAVPSIGDGRTRSWIEYPTIFDSITTPGKLARPTGGN